MKSGWELSRMIRQKRDQRQAEEDAVRVYRSLRRALHSGRMSDREYDYWFEKFLVVIYVLVAGLRKIRAHLRNVNDKKEKKSRRHGSRSSGNSSDRSRHYDDDERRQKSVRFDMRQTYYVPDPPQRFQDVEWPQSAGSIEYFPSGSDGPAKGKAEPQVIGLARLQRSSSVSYQRSEGSQRSHARRSESPERQEKERGRSRRREPWDACRHADTGFLDDWDHERLGYRSRR
ncbi:hypothetical protein BR93DRAFT_929524 [Coniochaeta sp. PMI_546]|nr:hypothetical protein BR93DRAFT_929524 [Coniochaeta sp. PMI_546]